jgi:gamma-glutamyltranspeptidase
MLIDEAGEAFALATPGADGQVQTLLQVIARMRFSGLSLADALTSPRWRSEGGLLLIERDQSGFGSDSPRSLSSVCAIPATTSLVLPSRPA